MQRSPALTALIGTLGMAFFAYGCSNAPGPGSTPTPLPTLAAAVNPIKTLQLVTDPAELAAMPGQIIPGAAPPKDYAVLFGFKGPEVQAVVIAPKHWAQTPVPFTSKDTAIFLSSFPSNLSQFRRPLEEQLRQVVASKINNPFGKLGVTQLYVLKLGGYDYPGEQAVGIEEHGKQNMEYHMAIDREDGRRVFFVMAGLPAFEGYFPLDLMLDFLNKLPKPYYPPPEKGTPHATETP